MTRPICLGLLAVFCAGAAWANPVEQACNMSGLPAATSEMCGCIGVAANLTLDARDQNQAAEFFADPQLAQDMRQSDRRRDEAFWQRYLSFGQVAEDMCG